LFLTNANYLINNAFCAKLAISKRLFARNNIFTVKDFAQSLSNRSFWPQYFLMPKIMFVKLFLVCNVQSMNILLVKPKTAKKKNVEINKRLSAFGSLKPS
jgi:hypothetical protein